ncbi:hypothetical protein HYR99_08605 [Candidatus Poribacteria bacterium]|nr:hypothetical protein [Candidatus Poribacteria bacterium]
MSLPRSLICILFFIFLSIWMARLSYGQEETEKVVYQLKNMHKHPWFWEVMVASVIGWVLGMVKEFSTSKDWLNKYWPNSPHLVVFFLDLIIFVCVGAYFGTGIYTPVNFVEALAAGLSWPIGLGALATGKKS